MLQYIIFNYINIFLTMDSISKIYEYNNLLN